MDGWTAATTAGVTRARHPNHATRPTVSASPSDSPARVAAVQPHWGQLMAEQSLVQPRRKGHDGPRLLDRSALAGSSHETAGTSGDEFTAASTAAKNDRSSWYQIPSPRGRPLANIAPSWWTRAAASTVSTTDETVVAAASAGVSRVTPICPGCKEHQTRAGNNPGPRPVLSKLLELRSTDTLATISGSCSTTGGSTTSDCGQVEHGAAHVHQGDPHLGEHRLELWLEALHFQRQQSGLTVDHNRPCRHPDHAGGKIALKEIVVELAQERPNNPARVVGTECTGSS